MGRNRSGPIQSELLISLTPEDKHETPRHRGTGGERSQRMPASAEGGTLSLATTSQPDGSVTVGDGRIGKDVHVD